MTCVEQKRRYRLHLQEIAPISPPTGISIRFHEKHCSISSSDHWLIHQISHRWSIRFASNVFQTNPKTFSREKVFGCSACLALVFHRLAKQRSFYQWQKKAFLSSVLSTRCSWSDTLILIPVLRHFHLILFCSSERALLLMAKSTETTKKNQQAYCFNNRKVIIRFNWSQEDWLLLAKRLRVALMISHAIIRSSDMCYFLLAKITILRRVWASITALELSRAMLVVNPTKKNESIEVNWMEEKYSSKTWRADRQALLARFLFCLRLFFLSFFLLMIGMLIASMPRSALFTSSLSVERERTSARKRTDRRIGQRSQAIGKEKVHILRLLLASISHEGRHSNQHEREVSFFLCI